MTYLVCLLKDRKGKDMTSLCGRATGLTIDQVTVWWREVTCPNCIRRM